MKIRRLVRLSHEFQVSECEAEIEVSNDSDILEVTNQLDTELQVAAIKGLQISLGQIKALKTKELNKKSKEQLLKNKTNIEKLKGLL